MATQTATASPVTRNEMRPVKYHYADTFWCTYIVSVVSANIAELGECWNDDNNNNNNNHNGSFNIFERITATYPLDLTKTRLQIQGEGNKVNGSALNAAKKVNQSWQMLANVDVTTILMQQTNLSKAEKKQKIMILFRLGAI